MQISNFSDFGEWPYGCRISKAKHDTAWSSAFPEAYCCAPENTTEPLHSEVDP